MIIEIVSSRGNQTAAFTTESMDYLRGNVERMLSVCAPKAVTTSRRDGFKIVNGKVTVTISDVKAHGFCGAPKFDIIDLLYFI